MARTTSRFVYHKSVILEYLVVLNTTLNINSARRDRCSPEATEGFKQSHCASRVQPLVIANEMPSTTGKTVFDSDESTGDKSLWQADVLY